MVYNTSCFLLHADATNISDGLQKVIDSIESCDNQARKDGDWAAHHNDPETKKAIIMITDGK